MKWIFRALVFIFMLAAGPLFMVSCGTLHMDRDWRTADRSSTGIAPPADTTPEAIVQVYAARAFNWRGAFAVHTWIASKPANAAHYTVHHGVGVTGTDRQCLALAGNGRPYADGWIYTVSRSTC